MTKSIIVGKFQNNILGKYYEQYRFHILYNYFKHSSFREMITLVYHRNIILMELDNNTSVNKLNLQFLFRVSCRADNRKYK